MRNEARRDILKVWLHAMASILLAAALAPWLWNLGMALAEVTEGKQTNGVVEWVAAGCRKAGWASYFNGAWVGAAVILFGPLVGWRKVVPGAANRTAPWSLRLPGDGRESAGGQRWRFRLGGGWLGLAGLSLSLLLMMGVAAVAVGTGAFRWSGGTDRLATAAIRVLLWAVGWAVGQEMLFRGVALGIFLRSMGAAAAVLLATMLFALVRYFMTSAGCVVVDPESAGAGFDMLGLLVKRLTEPRVFMMELLPWLALGGLLGYARWRTAALWLPVGLHAGWLVSNRLLQASVAPLNLPTPLARATLQAGLMPMVALLMAGIVLHFITPEQEDCNDAGD